MATGRRISFEYTLISGKNDSPEDARKLASTLRRYMSDGGRTLPMHVNLIPLNDVEGTGLSRSSKDAVRRFSETLTSLGITATVRRRLGPDINAACGQLRISSAEGKS